MRVSELREHLRSVHLDDVSNLVDGPDDSLAGADTTLRLFKAAQEDMARRTWCIVDQSTATVGSPAVPFCTIPLSGYSGLRVVPYHKFIIRVVKARFSDSEIPLRWSQSSYITPGAIDTTPQPDYFDVNAQYTYSAGRPGKYALDAATRQIEFDRPLDATTAALSLMLRVVRQPVVTLTYDLEPEVPEEYHLDLCDFVAGKILTAPTMDAGLRRAGQEYLKQWEATIVRVRREVRRREAVPGGWVFGGWAGEDLQR